MWGIAILWFVSGVIVGLALHPLIKLYLECND